VKMSHPKIAETLMSILNVVIEATALNVSIF
jgi:hypothetical protein